MATLVIADVHGQHAELKALLAKARPRASDRVVFVGDLVGRGPAAEAVLDAAMDLDGCEVTLGNHDLHLLRAHARGVADGPEQERLLAAAGAQQRIDWLRQRRLALAVDEAGALVCHAGLWHGWDRDAALAAAGEVEAALQGPDWAAALDGMFGDNASAWDAQLAGGPRLQAAVNILTRMRCCNGDGSISWAYRGEPGEGQPAGACAWFDYPLRRHRDLLVICGHWSSLGLLLRPDVAMLDCGCCFGGPLVGLWAEDRRLVCSA